jgi:hypothetical protein
MGWQRACKNSAPLAVVPALQSLPHTPYTNVSYHLIHSVIILISIRLSAYSWWLHLSIVTPNQLVWHKYFLAKVNLDLILSQKPIVPTNFAWALRYMMTTSKRLIQEIVDNLNPFF